MFTTWLPQRALPSDFSWENKLLWAAQVGRLELGNSDPWKQTLFFQGKSLRNSRLWPCSPPGPRRRALPSDFSREDRLLWAAQVGRLELGNFDARKIHCFLDENRFVTLACGHVHPLAPTQVIFLVKIRFSGRPTLHGSSLEISTPGKCLIPS